MQYQFQYFLLYCHFHNLDVVQTSRNEAKALQKVQKLPCVQTCAAYRIAQHNNEAQAQLFMQFSSKFRALNTQGARKKKICCVQKKNGSQGSKLSCIEPCVYSVSSSFSPHLGRERNRHFALLIIKKKGLEALKVTIGGSFGLLGVSACVTSVRQCVPSQSGLNVPSQM